MEIKNQKWQVGAFIFVGVMLFSVSLFLLDGNRLFQTYHHYFIDFDQVQGLNPGSIVSLAGINVGNVEQISLNPETHHIQVQVRVEKSLSHQITQGTEADLRTQGALGDKYIYLIPGPSNQEPLANKSFIPAVKGKDVLSVLLERGGEAGKLFDILNDVKDMTRQMNDKRRFERIMENMAEASENFKLASANVAKISSNPKLDQSINRLDNILSKIEKGQGTLGALINDPTIHEQLKSMLGGSKSKDNLRNVLRSTIKE